MADNMILHKTNQLDVFCICYIDEVIQEALNYAQSCGMMCLSVNMVQFPNEFNNNTAISLAKLERADGRVFEDVGVASPNNVPQCSADFIVSMSLGRAIMNVIVAAYNIFSYLGGNHEIITDNDFKNSICGGYLEVTPYQNIHHKPDLNRCNGKLVANRKEELINRLAERKYIDVQPLCMLKFGKRLQRLQGSEANKLIHYLK